MNNSVSLIYRLSTVYSLLIRILYGKHFLERYKSIKEYIPRGASVADICSGDCNLYHFALRGRNNYIGVDMNPSLNKKNRIINQTKIDVINDPLPISDFVIMQGSLYQFFPDHKKMVDKMLKSAKQKVIISEPVINLVNSNYGLISYLSKHTANSAIAPKSFRFTKSLLNNFFRKNYKDLVENISFAAGGRDMLFILRAK